MSILLIAAVLLGALAFFLGVFFGYAGGWEEGWGAGYAAAAADEEKETMPAEGSPFVKTSNSKPQIPS